MLLVLELADLELEAIDLGLQARVAGALHTGVGGDTRLHVHARHAAAQALRLHAPLRCEGRGKRGIGGEGEERRGDERGAGRRGGEGGAGRQTSRSRKEKEGGRKQPQAIHAKHHHLAP
eukprot:3426292-Rhodomonas_salina.6